jgi:hypothetical protein
MQMPRTREQLERAARDAEKWLDDMDPADVNAPGTGSSDLRRIGAALSTVAQAEADLQTAVRDAKLHGRSWADIAIVSFSVGVLRRATI